MPANAAIYLPVLQVNLGEIFESAKIRKPLFKKSTYFQVNVAADVIRLNVMPTEQITSHLGGFAGYIYSLPDDENRKQEACLAVSKTKTVLGLVTEKEFYENKALYPFLFKIAEAYSGLVFVKNSVIRADGNVLVGPLYETT
jgi:hypothetical protein